MSSRAWADLLVCVVFASACTSPPTSLLYVANRGSDDVSAYAIDTSTGALSPIGSPFRAGSAPGSIAVAPDGRVIYVANQFSHDVAAYTVQPRGALKPVPDSPFPTPAFPMSITVTASGRFVHVVSAGRPGNTVDRLGRVWTYNVDPTSGALHPIPGADVATGAAPIGMAIAHAGFVYATNLLSHDISAYTPDGATGTLAPVAGSPFPAYRARLGGPSLVNPLTGAEIPPPSIEVPHRPTAVAVAPAGVIYILGHAPGLPMPAVSGRASATSARDGTGRVGATALSSVSGYIVDESTGALSPITGSPWSAGRRPSAIALTPSGRFVYVANLESDNVSAFVVDLATNGLTEVSGSPFLAGARPSAIAVDPTGRFVYVANSGSNDITAYVIHEATGALRVMANAPFKAAAEPIAMVVLARR